jgi:chemotaxis protein CheX
MTATVAEDDVRQIAETIWSAMIGLDLRPVDPSAVRDRAGSTFTGCVHITGAWRGVVALHCSERLARTLAAVLFDVDAAAASIRETQDAVGELVNMTGGNLKALVPEPSQLSLPTVAQGGDFTVSVPGSRLVVQTAFECIGEPILLTMLESDD